MTARFLMWLHFTYTLLLPSLACIGSIILLEDDASGAILISIVPLFFYIYIYSVLYKVVDSAKHLVVILLTVPLLAGIDTLVFGDTVWHFFIESTAIEVGSFGLGIGYVVLRHAVSKSEPGCAVLGLVFSGTTVYGLMWPILSIRFDQHPLLCLIFFASLGLALLAFVSAQSAAHGSEEAGKVSRGAMTRDGGWLGRMVAGTPPPAVIGPNVREPVLAIVFMAILLSSPLIGIVVARFVYRIYF